MNTPKTTQAHFKVQMVRDQTNRGLAKKSFSDRVELIIERGESYFFSNNLPKDESEGKYYNDHEDYDQCYKAAAVFPIQRSYFQDLESGEEQTINDLMGFLCVDCSETNVFDKDETFAVMSTVADAMYWPFRRLKDAQQEE
jgi:hypothetical protein